MSNRQRETGELARMVACNFCGGQHRRKSKELRECRRNRGQASLEPVVKASEEAQAGDETTRYQSDPLRGDKRAHSIAKKLRSGKPPRRIAKELNVSLSVVRQVMERMA